jgi:type IV pilus assembly protein PilA
MRDRKGFTLIELLIVVVIIGILAAIAIPKFSKTRERAYVSAMKSDLRNLANQQELYFGQWYVYSGDQTALDWSLSARVLNMGITATATGYSAIVSHPGMSTPPGDQCYIYFGDEAPLGPPNLPPGVVGCDGEVFDPV